MTFGFDTTDRLIISQVDDLSRTVITAAWKEPSRSPAGQALLALFVRIANSWKSLTVLLGTCSSDGEFQVVGNDCGAILRCMYDAYFQAEFIAHDPATRDQMGQLYLDYQHVELYRQMKALVAQANPLAKILQNSPRRNTGEPRVQAEYDRVKSKFPGRGGDGVRNHWYPNGLFELAGKVGKQDLYDWVVTPYHGCVHSGPFAVFHGPMLPGVKTIFIGLYPVAATAQLLVNLESLPLNKEQRELMESNATDLVQTGLRSERREKESAAISGNE